MQQVAVFLKRQKQKLATTAVMFSAVAIAIAAYAPAGAQNTTTPTYPPRNYNNTTSTPTYPPRNYNNTTSTTRSTGGNGTSGGTSTTTNGTNGTTGTTGTTGTNGTVYNNTTNSTNGTQGTGVTSTTNPANVSIGGPSDCNSNAVIRCGAHSVGAIMQAYQNDPYVRNVFSGFGISSSDINNIGSTAVAGRVTRSGNVYVNGDSRAVATNAMTAGRTNMPNSRATSSGNMTYYRRAPRDSFQQSSLPAYVVMQNGQFRYAIVASCGNPVTATPRIPQTTTPTPAPTPAPVPAPAPAPTPVPTPAPIQPTTPAPCCTTPAPSQQQTQTQSVVVNEAHQPPETTTTTTTTPPATVTAAPAPAPAPTPQPVSTTLPNTGPAGYVAAFLLSTGAGILGFRRFLSSKLS